MVHRDQRVSQASLEKEDLMGQEDLKGTLVYLDKEDILANVEKRVSWVKQGQEFLV